MRDLDESGFANQLRAANKVKRAVYYKVKARPYRSSLKRRMRRSPILVHRFKAFARKTSLSAAVFFVLDVSRAASTFFPISPASILTPHGSDGLKV